MTGEKRLPQLDARLSAAAGYVRPGHVAADIGCDHGKLTVDLLVSGRCPKVIAADLRPIPLSKAQENCRKAGCADRAELRLGNGLEVLQPGEATDIVIAGMGAETIIEILQAAPWARPLSPAGNSAWWALRPASRARRNIAGASW